MGNMKKAAVVIILIIACALVLVSCDTKDDVTYYQETVVGKYGDGIRLIGIVTPEVEPTYLTDLPRIEKEIYFDTRLEGWHFSGIYVVKGEKITITLPADKADGSIVAAVGRYLPSSSVFRVALDKPEVTFVSTTSGLLDINLGNCYGDDFWKLSVSGGVAASYYRLGIDRTAEWEDSVGYAVADATNVRIYLPAENIDSSSDVEKAVAWWRSLCEYLDNHVIGDFAADKLSPTDVFVGQHISAPYYDKKSDVLYVPSSYADIMLDADALADGAGWDLILELSKGKVAYAGLNDVQAEVAQVIAAGAYVTLTDGIADSSCGDEYWINNAYECLRMSMNGELASYGNLSAYVNLIHSFGAEKIVAAAIEYLKQSQIQSDTSQEQTTKADSLAQYLTDVFAAEGSDLEPYFEKCGIEVVKAAEGLAAYVPLQSKYALGAECAADKTGITVNSGETAYFDFAEGYLSAAGESRLVKVLLGGKEWLPQQDGLYAYRPDDSLISQDFILVYEADGQTVTRAGRFTCNIEVSVFSRYENVPWRDMKTAVKEYEESGAEYLTNTSAVFKAEIPQNDEVDDSVYTFSVNKGVIQVEETATYLIYLKNKGMTRVDFGVPEYMFTMFENTLTVTEYTDLLCYEIELQKDVAYYYDMYILATKGNAYACLGISKKGETQINDIDDGYLVYHSFTKDDAADYSAPALIPDTFRYVKEGRKNFDDLKVALADYPAPANGSSVSAATDANDDTSFTSKDAAVQTYLFELEEVVNSDYVVLKTGTSGVNYELSYSSDGESFTVCDKGVLSKIIDVDFVRPQQIKAVKLTLTSDTPFAGVIKDIYFGSYTKNATIVPSNSSRVLYQGKWQYKTGGISVNGWILESYGDDAAIEFNFYGTSISVYCVKGDVYGNMQIYVDGKQYAAVDLSSKETQYDCNVFSVDFQTPGKHRIRIVPSSNDDIINLDYFTVVYAVQEDANPEVGNLWYFAIIPAALLVIFAVCLALDIIERHNKKHKIAQKSGQIPSDEKEEESES